MTLRTGRAGVWTLAALVAALGVASAQQPAFKRTELQRGDLSVAGREVVTAIAEIPAGAASGKHSHPGEEVVYMIEGLLEYQLEGQPPVTLKAGDVLFIPAGTIHRAKNVGSGTGSELATYIVEKGKPLVVLAK